MLSSGNNPIQKLVDEGKLLVVSDEEHRVTYKYHDTDLTRILVRHRDSQERNLGKEVYFNYDMGADSSPQR